MTHSVNNVADQIDSFIKTCQVRSRLDQLTTPKAVAHRTIKQEDQTYSISPASIKMLTRNPETPGPGELPKLCYTLPIKQEALEFVVKSVRDRRIRKQTITYKSKPRGNSPKPNAISHDYPRFVIASIDHIRKLPYSDDRRDKTKFVDPSMVLMVNRWEVVCASDMQNQFVIGINEQFERQMIIDILATYPTRDFRDVVVVIKYNQFQHGIITILLIESGNVQQRDLIAHSYELKGNNKSFLFAQLDVKGTVKVITYNCGRANFQQVRLMTMWN